jgi:hypothetical protein
MIKGAGHLLVMEKPDEFNSLVEDFLECKEPRALLLQHSGCSLDLVGAAGLEPATLCLEGRCSIHLSYAPASTVYQRRYVLGNIRENPKVRNPNQPKTSISQFASDI